MIHFHVPAVPVAQPRPRATAINGRARVFEAKAAHPVHSFKASVRLAASAVHSGAPIEGPLGALLVFVFPRPKGMIWKKRDMPRVWHAKKPDADNCAKSLLDALNGTLFNDDSQIAACKVEKWIAAGDEQPGVYVTINKLTD